MSQWLVIISVQNDAGEWVLHRELRVPAVDKSDARRLACHQFPRGRGYRVGGITKLDNRAVRTH